MLYDLAEEFTAANQIMILR